MALTLAFPSSWKEGKGRKRQEKEASSCFLPSGCSLYVLLIFCCLTNYFNVEALLSQIFCRPEMWDQFSWVALDKGFTWGWSADLSWGFSHLKAWLGLEVPLPRCFIYTSDRLELLEGRSESLSTWFSPRTAWVSSWHGGWLAPERVIQKSKVEALTPLMTQPQKSNTFISAVLYYTETIPDLLWEETT